MNRFDFKDVLEKTLEILGGWVRREQPSAPDIEQLGGVAEKVGNTCWQCIALNRTVFKDNNKPEYTHENCECTQKPYYLNEATVLFSKEKVTNYLFREDKKGPMMKTMGYYFEDAEYIYNLVYNIAKSYFENGNYVLTYLNQYGQHYQINFLLNGKRDHSQEKFNCYIGCVAWPNAQIYIATPLVKN